MVRVFHSQPKDWVWTLMSLNACPCRHHPPSNYQCILLSVKSVYLIYLIDWFNRLNKVPRDKKRIFPAPHPNPVDSHRKCSDLFLTWFAMPVSLVMMQCDVCLRDLCWFQVENPPGTTYRQTPESHFTLKCSDISVITLTVDPVLFFQDRRKAEHPTGSHLWHSRSSGSIR